jgi:hypothetical protein
MGVFAWVIPVFDFAQTNGWMYAVDREDVDKALKEYKSRLAEVSRRERYAASPVFQSGQCLRNSPANAVHRLICDRFLLSGVHQRGASSFFRGRAMEARGIPVSQAIGTLSRP